MANEKFKRHNFLAKILVPIKDDEHKKPLPPADASWEWSLMNTVLNTVLNTANAAKNTAAELAKDLLKTPPAIPSKIIDSLVEKFKDLDEKLSQFTSVKEFDSFSADPEIIETRKSIQNYTELTANFNQSLEVYKEIISVKEILKDLYSLQKLKESASDTENNFLSSLKEYEYKIKNPQEYVSVPVLDLIDIQNLSDLAQDEQALSNDPQYYSLIMNVLYKLFINKAKDRDIQILMKDILDIICMSEVTDEDKTQILLEKLSKFSAKKDTPTPEQLLVLSLIQEYLHKKSFISNNELTDTKAQQKNIFLMSVYKYKAHHIDDPKSTTLNTIQIKYLIDLLKELDTHEGLLPIRKYWLIISFLKLCFPISKSVSPLLENINKIISSKSRSLQIRESIKAEIQPELLINYPDTFEKTLIVGLTQNFLTLEVQPTSQAEKNTFVVMLLNYKIIALTNELSKFSGNSVFFENSSFVLSDKINALNTLIGKLDTGSQSENLEDQYGAITSFFNDYTNLMTPDEKNILSQIKKEYERVKSNNDKKNNAQSKNNDASPKTSVPEENLTPQVLPTLENKKEDQIGEALKIPLKHNEKEDLREKSDSPPEGDKNLHTQETIISTDGQKKKKIKKKKKKKIKEASILLPVTLEEFTRTNTWFKEANNFLVKKDLKNSETAKEVPTIALTDSNNTTLKEKVNNDTKNNEQIPIVPSSDLFTPTVPKDVDNMNKKIDSSPSLTSSFQPENKITPDVNLHEKPPINTGSSESEGLENDKIVKKEISNPLTNSETFTQKPENLNEKKDLDIKSEVEEVEKAPEYPNLQKQKIEMLPELKVILEKIVALKALLQNEGLLKSICDKHIQDIENKIKEIEANPQNQGLVEESELFYDNQKYSLECIISSEIRKKDNYILQEKSKDKSALPILFKNIKKLEAAEKNVHTLKESVAQTKREWQEEIEVFKNMIDQETKQLEKKHQELISFKWFYLFRFIPYVEQKYQEHKNYVNMTLPSTYISLKSKLLILTSSINDSLEKNVLPEVLKTEYLNFEENEDVQTIGIGSKNPKVRKDDFCKQYQKAITGLQLLERSNAMLTQDETSKNALEGVVKKELKLVENDKHKLQMILSKMKGTSPLDPISSNGNSFSY